MTQREAGRKVCCLKFTGRPALRGGGYGNGLSDLAAAPFLRGEGHGQCSTISLSAVVFAELTWPLSTVFSLIPQRNATGGSQVPDA